VEYETATYTQRLQICSPSFSSSSVKIAATQSSADMRPISSTVFSSSLNPALSSPERGVIRLELLHCSRELSHLGAFSSGISFAIWPVVEHPPYLKLIVS